MNTRQAIQAPAGNVVLSAAFSASGKRFVATLNDGLRIFRTDNCLSTYHPNLTIEDSGVSIAHVLDDRLSAFVYNRKISDVDGPNVVVIWDAVLDRELAKFDFHEPVLGLRLTPRYMAVILEGRTVLFQYQELERHTLPELRADDRDSEVREHAMEQETLRAPNLVHSLCQTAPNVYALCSISNDLLVLPAQSIGQVHLITLKSGGSTTKRVLPAHNSSLRCLALSDDGTLLATASEQGTLIRIWDTKTLAQIVEHRRGMDHAIIYSLAFSPGNRWIASTSDKGTLHVFDLRSPDPARASVATQTAKERQHRRSQSYAQHRLSTGNDKDSLSGMSAGRSSPAPSTALPSGGGAGYPGSIQEYYGLRPPPISASPPARDAAVSAMAALKASPFAPRIFRDTRSVASAPFYMGNDKPYWQGGLGHSWTTAPNGTRKRVKNAVLPLPNDPSGRPPKGVMRFGPSPDGSNDNDYATIYVVGGGSDARWEKFQLLPASSVEGAAPGGWVLVNQGFKKYLTRQFAE